MELRETKHSTNSVEINKVKPSKGNNSDNKRIYNLLYPVEDYVDDHDSDSQPSNQDERKTIFGSVSTIEWLSTWRSIEIS